MESGDQTRADGHNAGPDNGEGSVVSDLGCSETAAERTDDHGEHEWKETNTGVDSGSALDRLKPDGEEVDYCGGIS